MLGLEIQKIIDYYSLGQLLRFHPLNSQGFSHVVWQLYTVSGKFLLKQFNSSINKKILTHTNHLACQFKANNMPVVSAVGISDKPVLEMNKNLWMLFPWCEGKVFSLTHVNILHANIIAKLITKLHQCSITNPNDKIEIIKVDEELLIKLGKEYIEKTKLIKWLKQFYNYADLIQNDIVTSHRDLIQTNIIWQNDNNPILIDWDNAGLINRSLDVFNTAINWAGINKSYINIPVYLCFMKTYRESANFPLVINKGIVQASYGGWLQWLIFNLKRVNQLIPATEKQIMYAKNEIVTTISAIMYLEKYMDKLLIS